MNEKTRWIKVERVNTERMQQDIQKKLDVVEAPKEMISGGGHQGFWKTEKYVWNDRNSMVE